MSDIQWIREQMPNPNYHHISIESLRGNLFNFISEQPDGTFIVCNGRKRFKSLNEAKLLYMKKAVKVLERIKKDLEQLRCQI